MSVSRLPNGRWRGQVYHQGKTVSVARVLGLPPEESTFSSKRKAEDAVAAARKILAQRSSSGVTVREWAETWTTDPYWARPKESTDIQNRRRIRAFVDKYGGLPLEQVGDRQVGELVRGSRATLLTVRAMFRDAMRLEAGRLIDRDPFLGVKVGKSSGNGHVDPPGEDVVWELVRVARERVNPGFAAWLQVAAFTGMRPGELDGLRWSSVDFARGRIRVVEQFNRTTCSFTLPKNGRKREAILTDQAREALEGLFRSSEFCFTNLRGRHWTERARSRWWRSKKKDGTLEGVAPAVGYEGSLYLATRHFSGWYMTNVLRLPAEVVAVALGHTDGGKLVQDTYGHLDKDRVLDEVLAAYRSAGNVVALREVPKVEASHELHTGEPSAAQ